MERLISRGRKFEISCPFFSFLTSYYLMKGIFCMTGGPLGRKPPFGYIEGFFTGFSKKNEIFAHFLGKIGNFFTV